MPALVASRFNPDLKATYQRLKATGKPAKVAITAIMRKLVVLANALLSNRRNWQPLLLDQHGYSMPKPSIEPGSNASPSAAVHEPPLRADTISVAVSDPMVVDFGCRSLSTVLLQFLLTHAIRFG